MERFVRLYEAMKKAFWHSLSRKRSSIVLQLFMEMAYVAVYGQQKAAVETRLRVVGVSPRGDERVMSVMHAGVVAFAVLTAVALASTVGHML